MTLPVFVGDDARAHLPLRDLSVGDALHLGGDEGHHAGAVTRTLVGELLDVVDGRGLRLTCEVTAVAPKGRGVDLRVVDRAEEARPAVALTLVQALAKGGRDEQAVETATEVGATGVVPWQASRSIARWTGPKVERGVAKWEGVVRAATKQSRRAWLPEVAAPVDSHALAAFVAERVAGGALCLLCHEEAAVPLTGVLAATAWEEVPEVLVVVGPEGGVSPEEVAALEAAGARTVLLGPHVLRSSTAGPVALTLVQAAAGLW